MSRAPMKPYVPQAHAYVVPRLSTTYAREVAAIQAVLNGDWRPVLNGVVGAIESMEVIRARPNRTGNRIDVRVQCHGVQLQVPYFDNDRTSINLRIPSTDGQVVDLHLVSAGGARRTINNLANEVLDRFLEIGVTKVGTPRAYACSVESLLSTHMNSLARMNAEHSAVALSFGHYLIRDAVRVMIGTALDNTPGIKAVYDAFCDKVGASREAFSGHVVRKVLTQLEGVVTEAFKHGATRDQMMNVIDNALVRSLMEG